MTLGRKIQKLRKEKGWTQEDLASKVGVSAQAVSKWETDVSSPDISLLRPLAELFETNVDNLLSMSETYETPVVQMAEPEKRKKFEELVLRVNVLSQGGDKVKINLPMPLIKLGLEMGMAMPQLGDKKDMLKNIDLEQIMQLVEKGVSGKLVEVESADGDMVEIVVE